ncbi:MAG: ATPase, partial [Oscillibacter sp.]
MEVNAAATGSTLTERVKQYLDTGGIPIATLAREIEYSRTTVSRYLCGKYDSDATDLERRLHE